MLFKKKTLDEKMEKYVKHHDWYAIQEVITGDLLARMQKIPHDRQTIREEIGKTVQELHHRP